jgi:hypothetical protein
MNWVKLLLLNPRFLAALGTLIVSVSASLGFVMEEPVVIEVIGYIASAVLMTLGVNDTKKKVSEQTKE